MGNQQVLEVCCFSRKEVAALEKNGSAEGQKPIEIQQPSNCCSIVFRLSKSNERSIISNQYANLPFESTHIKTFKRMVDSLKSQEFTISDMAAKFTVFNCSSEWKSKGTWEEASDLNILLKYYLPDSQGNGVISYNSLLSLGLLLCKGSTHDKAQVLLKCIQQFQKNGEEIDRDDEHLSLLVFSMIEFSISKSLQFYLRSESG